MIEREKAEHYVVVCEGRAVWCDELIDVRDQVVVREHDAFGKAGGAAGVGKSGDR